MTGAASQQQHVGTWGTAVTEPAPHRDTGPDGRNFAPRHAEPRSSPTPRLSHTSPTPPMLLNEPYFAADTREEANAWSALFVASNWCVRATRPCAHVRVEVCTMEPSARCVRRDGWLGTEDGALRRPRDPPAGVEVRESGAGSMTSGGRRGLVGWEGKGWGQPNTTPPPKGK